jgi:hypothetical protein
MFLSEKIPALFKKGTLKLQEDKGDVKRVVEATFLIEPFSPHLAHELGEEIAGHLFDRNDEIRDELDAIDLRLRVGLQKVTARRHEDLDACAVLQPVSVKDASVKRIDEVGSGLVWDRSTGRSL